MIKVECVSCKSPYDVDERRVPDSGMKMRCPKCNTSFLVNKDGSTVAVGLTVPLAPPPPAAIANKTLVGQQPSVAGAFGAKVAGDAPARAAMKGTMVGISPAALTAPNPVPLAPKPADAADLPALKAQPKPPVPWGSLAPPSPDAKSQGSLGAAGGQLPKGAAGSPSLPVPSAADKSNRAGAASAFGTASVPKVATPAFAAYDEAELVDLPAPKAAPDAGGFVDLPAPRGAARPDFDFGPPLASLPALEVDLPAPKPIRAHEPAAGAIDLPAPKPIRAHEPAAGAIDLPAPKLSVDLPAPKASAGRAVPKRTLVGSAPLASPPSAAPAFGEIDLPAPKLIADLPAPRGVADLPAPRGVADLPVPKAGGAGFGDLDLPMPMPPTSLGTDEASFGDIDLPDLPAAPRSPTQGPGNRGLGGIQLPSPRAAADLVPPKAPTVQGGHRAAVRPADESSFGDLNPPRAESLPPSLMGASDESSFGDLEVDDDEPLARMDGSMGGSIPPALLGGDDGDSLGGDDLVSEGDDDEDFGELPEGGDGSEEDMEFGMADGEGDVALPPEMLRRQRGEDTTEDPAVRSKRALRMVIGVAIVLALIGGAGAALGFTDHGFFGVFYLERFMQGAGDSQFVRSAISRAEKTAATDTFRDARRSLSDLGVARHGAGLNRELLARSIVHEGLFLVRFGAETNSSAHLPALLSRLQERHNVAQGMDLALAADAARRQAWAEAEPLIAAARSQAPTDAYVELLAGEVAVRQGKLAEAEKSFGLALKHGGSARAQWGLARIAIAKNDDKAAQGAIDATLQLSPKHVEARIANARLLWNQGKEDRALTALRQALGLEAVDDQFLWSAKAAQAQGYSTLAYVHEARGRLHLARAAYDDALVADPYLVEGLLGAGRVMLREKRFADALARFESALNIAQKSVNPVVLSGRKADVEARLGQGRAQLALDRAPEAKGVLSVLQTENPNDAEIVLAVGQAEEALGNRETSEALLRKAIELAPTTFAGYLALSQFYLKQNQIDKASETLNESQSKVEESAEMRRMLGQSELARNRLESAVHEFKRAVELDPQDLDAKFGLAIAYRKNGALDDARRFFDEVRARDPLFANLTLERGQLFEARGEYAKAIESYKQALEKAPTDLQLMLRLGAAQVESGALDDAEQTLAKVIRETPNSAEAEYFIGRIAFGRGRGPDALTHFDRALSLDASQAVFHLYAGRAAFSLQNIGRTNEEVNLALTRDPSLGDAYWVRGEVRIRTGAVKDALKDLQRALVLKPDRYEIYAAMAECHDQLRELPQAVQMWRTALGKDPKNGEWWYKLGRLHLDMGERNPAQDALQKARELGDATDPLPAWLSDAYRLSGEIARVTNNRKLAITLFQRYLDIAPTGAMDREEVRGILRGWEVELDEP